ncbi:hypothetical protein [Xanthobacter aminoxidans]|nr:hypothetical protein [Xanthobacter aminoxidans]MCL8382073.1 hypothetical protein [Xanthobacter aminoxidans]
MAPLTIVTGMAAIVALIVHCAVSRALYGQRLHRVDRAFSSSRKPRA